VGTAIGAVAGVVAGTAVAGPVGGAAAAALVAGGLAGGLVGKYTGEAIDPTVEDAYWRERHPLESYGAGTSYEEYEPAYRAGYEGYGRHGGERFDEVESDIRKEYEKSRTSLPWERARPASEAAWRRVHERQATRAPRDETGGPTAANDL
jgi:hypothetical protein